MSTVVKQVKRLQGAVVVVASGEVTIEESPAFHKSLVAVCSESPQNLVINMAEVTYIDSSGVGTLVDIYRRVRLRGSKMSLVCLTQTVRSVFEITKLDKFFTILETEQEALSP